MFYNGRAVIPLVLRTSILKTLHQGHVGISRMRLAAKPLIWWPNLDKELVNMANSCEQCNIHAARNPDAVNRVKRPECSIPWERVHLDIFDLEQHQFFILVDSNSNWVHVERLPSATAANVIYSLKE